MFFAYFRTFQRSVGEVADLASQGREKQEKLLILWMFEDELIKYYADFVNALMVIALSTETCWHFVVFDLICLGYFLIICFWF